MTSGAPTRTVLDLTGVFSHAGHVMETRLTAALREIDLTPRQVCVLQKAMERERTQIEVAALAHLDKTTMVVTMDELEKAGYAQRRPSATDRRARIIEVTPAGAQIAQAGQEIVDRVHAELLDALPKEQRAQFLDALLHLLDGPLTSAENFGRPVRRARQSAK